MTQYQVTIESPDDGGVSFLVGPFQSHAEAEEWRAAFLSKYAWFDEDFVAVQELWTLTHPDSPEIDAFYGD